MSSDPPWPGPATLAFAQEYSGAGDAFAPISPYQAEAALGIIDLFDRLETHSSWKIRGAVGEHFTTHELPILPLRYSGPRCPRPEECRSSAVTMVFHTLRQMLMVQLNDLECFPVFLHGIQRNRLELPSQRCMV